MIRLVKTSSDFRCEKCCYKGTDECAKANCACGYFTDKPSAQKRTRTRKSRDRRLLEALLNDMEIVIDGDSRLQRLQFKLNTVMPQNQRRQLIAIKQAMERKGGGK